MSRIVILDARRTPIGKFLGGLSSLSAADLGVAVVEPLLQRAGLDPSEVSELIFGCARQAGGGPNVARQVAVRSGISESSTALTVNMACGSGLLALIAGRDAIATAEASMMVVGGTESMSRLPYYIEGLRDGLRLGQGELVDGMYRDGFHCPLADQLMGGTAENLAQEYDISREEQDTYAVESQRRCQVAREEGRFASEIEPVEVRQRKGTITVDKDEHPRDDVTIDGMAKLKPVFKEDGTIHAGNASGITDGAAALLIASEETATRLGLEPIAIVGASARAGVEPRRMGIGPVPAIAKLLEKTGATLADFDLIELNEAFAAQVIACDRELSLDRERLNVNGGAIALGHPIGATGARIVVTLVHELRRRGGGRGLATLCISGGQGLALDVEVLAP
ncbi:MAG TPA: thiolase family protein [Planctomycetes bacterium]|nr:thiolase family protein [Planctomycetota bacterium]HIN80409.1 thiolase family protein [Planctomycetota bacterium]